MSTVGAADVVRSRADAAGGRSVLQVLNRCMAAALANEVDAICFAPLNKHAMKLGGLRHEDELHHFAEFLGVTNYFCEFNTLDGLWTSRISSHVPFADITKYVTRERVMDAARLMVASLKANGVSAPRVAVAGLNPHNGEGGTCGREEVDVIAPAVQALRDEGLPVTGPFSADTIFLKAQAGEFDAIVTLYHDQGQIAIKLLGFSRGVTVQGGLPIPITTPAHGTAYDIAGQGRADVQATFNAFQIAARMGSAQRKSA
jgi:4-hydroxythreonine-4-phosphate dehydrogenase